MFAPYWNTVVLTSRLTRKNSFFFDITHIRIHSHSTELLIIVIAIFSRLSGLISGLWYFVIITGCNIHWTWQSSKWVAGDANELIQDHGIISTPFSHDSATHLSGAVECLRLWPDADLCNAASMDIKWTECCAPQQKLGSVHFSSSFCIPCNRRSRIRSASFEYQS